MHALKPVNARMLYAAGITEPHIERHLQSLSQTLGTTLLEQMQSVGLGPSEVYITQEHPRP